MDEKHNMVFLQSFAKKNAEKWQLDMVPLQA
jgi:hypothetical protein